VRDEQLPPIVPPIDGHNLFSEESLRTNNLTEMFLLEEILDKQYVCKNSDLQ